MRNDASSANLAPLPEVVIFFSSEKIFKQIVLDRNRRERGRDRDRRDRSRSRTRSRSRSGRHLIDQRYVHKLRKTRSRSPHRRRRTRSRSRELRREHRERGREDFQVGF